VPQRGALKALRFAREPARHPPVQPTEKQVNAMKDLPDNAHVFFPRWGFGASLLDALHETRRRQAAREIHNHRYLVDQAKADEMWARLFASQ
jgi:hypothetical protein